MYIARISIDEGFLDGLDIALTRGLNVIIGARGTGKTSLIELIRFCVDVKGSTPDSQKRSREHALSVLGNGQVTLTMSNGAETFTLTRTASDDGPRFQASFSKPIIFSQTEIENVGLQPGGRLQLIDSFDNDRRGTDLAESSAVSMIRSLTKEADELRREISDLKARVFGLNVINQQLAELAPKENELGQVSIDAKSRKIQLDDLSSSISSLSVASLTITRFSAAIDNLIIPLQMVVGRMPTIESWPMSAGDDTLLEPRRHLERAKQLLNETEASLLAAKNGSTIELEKIAKKKSVLDETSRVLRREVDALQAGAGAIVRQAQQLREKKAQLESLRALFYQRDQELEILVQKRDLALDELDRLREERFQKRQRIANDLNKTLGPRIKISVTRAGQFDALTSTIAETLKGSGLRYNDLSLSLSSQLSPRELLEAAENNDLTLITDASGISKDRSIRLLSQLRESDLGALATVLVEDAVIYQLLDGTDYKDISQLSTGQRCSVVLPLILRHTERLLIVDQPEDHIDNAFIADTLIQSILARNPNGQLIFATHNANIPILGQAELVVHLGSDGRRGFALEVAPLEDMRVVNAITTVMEGGKEAFSKRSAFYGRRR